VTIDAALCITVVGICCTDDPQCDIDFGICPTGKGKCAIGSGICRRCTGISRIDVGIQTIDLPLSRIDSGILDTDAGVWRIDSAILDIDCPILGIGDALSRIRARLLSVEGGAPESQRSSLESSNSFHQGRLAARDIEHSSGRMGIASSKMGQGRSTTNGGACEIELGQAVRQFGARQ